MMEKFEYMLVPVLMATPIKSIAERLDLYGDEGWELCGIEYGAFIFKRKVPKC